MKTIRIYALTILLAVMASPVFAQAEDPILTLPDGQVILSIQATERKDVAQDLLVGSLSYVATHADAQQVQNEINKAMTKALDIAKKVEALKVNTGSYSVYETTDQRSKEKVWRGSQSLSLKSQDAEALLEVAGELQELGLTVNGLSYEIDPKTAISVQDGLMEDALKQLQERANRAAAALGKSGAELRDVSVQGAGMPYYAATDRMEMRAMSSMEPVQYKPVAQSGEETISLTVSARAILKP